ncbi:MAG: hypothetical protein J6J36_01210 [Clostridia bacterium]|nr:hypothetical protein [Clostridia bacterium]
MKENYPKAYTEVLEILKYMPKEDVKKIPKNILEMLKKNRDITYNFVVTENDDFSKLNILDETEAIFVNFFRDYWATPKQRDKLIAKQICDMKNIEKEKTSKYNPEDIFSYKEENNTKDDFTETEKSNNDRLLVKDKESFFRKFVNFFKRLLKL